MPFDRAKAIADADTCERNLQILYRALGIPFITLKLLDDALVVRCDDETDVPTLCGKVVAQYQSPEGATLN